MGFEDAVDRLESLIEQIETGEVGLEEALKRYEDGTKLIQHCRKILDVAERKISELTGEGEAGPERGSAPGAAAGSEGSGRDVD